MFDGFPESNPTLRTRLMFSVLSSPHDHVILLVLMWRCFGIVALHPLHGAVATGRPGIVTSSLPQPTGLTGRRGSGSDLALPSGSLVAKLHVHPKCESAGGFSGRPGR